MSSHTRGSFSRGAAGCCATAARLAAATAAVPARTPRRLIRCLGCMIASLNGKRLAEVQLLEEVVALVVDDDEGGEILHLDAPDRLHAELGIFLDLDLLDAVLGEVGGGAADGREVEAAMTLAGLAHLRGAIALGDRDERAAGGLERVDIGVHAAGRGRAEG